ncbi:hypothetical protein [Streptomyces sp. NPDC047042]|uniref:hypothetical protein n=1 Tax=Streptomyces sp. NPDC047042 TaxID=3154807 RepID=UPI0033FEC0D2
MHDRLAAVLNRALCPPALLFLCLLLPATGRRRKASAAPLTAIRISEAKEGTERRAHRVVQGPIPRRSPYSTDLGPLDGASSPLSRPYLPALAEQAPAEMAAVAPRSTRVRPYWTARERAAQLRRRTALMLRADLRSSLDTRDIHAGLARVRFG